MTTDRSLAAAAAERDRIAAADAVLIVSPECNCSIPGVFKNAARPGVAAAGAAVHATRRAT